MADAALILLQKRTSLFSVVLEQALGKNSGVRLLACQQPTLPQVAHSSLALVVWEPESYDQDERKVIAQELCSAHLGLLLAGRQESRSFRRTLNLVEPLAIITPAQPP